MEVITSNKGGRKLIFENHMYTIKKESDVVIYWICTRRQSDKCNGALKTLITLDEPQVKKETNLLSTSYSLIVQVT